MEVIYVIPAPISKLSMDTKNEKVMDSIKLMSFSFISSLYDFIISTNIINNVAISINFEFIVYLFVSIFPISNPINGIKKWKIPTVMDVIIIFFFFMFNSPYATDNVNASILKLIAINIIVNCYKLLTYLSIVFIFLFILN